MSTEKALENMKVIRKLMFKAFIHFIIIAVFGLLMNIPQAYAESELSRENKIKAVLIYRFTKFIEWTPESFSDNQDPLILTIIGNDPLSKAIDALHGKKVKGRKLLIKRITSIEDIDKSHIFYIAQSEKERLTEILQTTRELCVLTISDIKGFSKKGGIINFFMVENTVRFEINVAAAQEAGLEVKPSLLKLSKVVGNKNRNGKN